jgi:hypothetical protein
MIERSWRPFLTSPLGVNFDHQGKVVPQGLTLSPKVKFSVRPSILLNSRECSPLGVNEGMNIPPGDKFHPWGPSSPLGANFTPHVREIGFTGQETKFLLIRNCRENFASGARSLRRLQKLERKHNWVITFFWPIFFFIVLFSCEKKTELKNTLSDLKNAAHCRKMVAVDENGEIFLRRNWKKNTNGEAPFFHSTWGHWWRFSKRIVCKLQLQIQL